MFLYSFLISVVSVSVGLVLSYHLGTAGSATMALVPITAFFLVLALTRVRHTLLVRSGRATRADVTLSAILDPLAEQ